MSNPINTALAQSIGERMKPFIRKVVMELHANPNPTVSVLERITDTMSEMAVEAFRLGMECEKDLRSKGR